MQQSFSTTHQNLYLYLRHVPVLWSMSCVIRDRSDVVPKSRPNRLDEVRLSVKLTIYLELQGRPRCDGKRKVYSEGELRQGLTLVGRSVVNDKAGK